MRATARASGVSYNSVCALQDEARPACVEIHDKTLRGVRS